MREDTRIFLNRIKILNIAFIFYKLSIEISKKIINLNYSGKMIEILK
jgi:hypothetical protein